MSLHRLVRSVGCRRCQATRVPWRTLTGGKNPALQCTGTFVLPAGTLTESALIHAGGKSVQRIAILGGTGAYEGARGSILSVPKTQSTSIDTVHLLP